MHVTPLDSNITEKCSVRCYTELYGNMINQRSDQLYRSFNKV